MRPYFEKMDDLGKPLKPSQVQSMAENRREIEEVVKALDAEVNRVKNAGLPAAKIHERGEMTVWDRIDYLVDPGCFCPLNTLYNPRDNEEGTTGVIVLSRAETRDQPSLPCIKCGHCLDACPVFLNPQLLGALAGAERYQEMETAHLADCMLCGCCSYVCPSHIPLSQLFAASKARVRKLKVMSA